jgi:hypothetical protein
MKYCSTYELSSEEANAVQTVISLISSIEDLEEEGQSMPISTDGMAYASDFLCELLDYNGEDFIR